jgi:hemerythrin-like domain-containing protein
MKEFIEKYIKEIIDEYPEVAKTLEDSNIGCVTCNVGTCRLKDIIEIHNLSEDEEQVILSKIAKIIYPDKKIEIPEIKKKVRPAGIQYSPPLRILVDEHAFIKQLLSQIPDLIKELEENPENGRALASESVEFIRFYADKFHHAKEEDILFKYFDENLDILKVILEDHETSRGHVRKIMEGLEKLDNTLISEHVQNYTDLLTEHIKKEDEILYPWLDRNLSTNQIGELFSKFQDVKMQFGDEPKKYEEFVQNLKQNFNSEEVLP